MTYSDVLPFCLFFKGEAIAPPSFDMADSRLWLAEKKTCEEFPFLVEMDNPRTSLAQVVYSYLGKWFPYTANDLMSRYFEKAPELRSSLELV